MLPVLPEELWPVASWCSVSRAVASVERAVASAEDSAVVSSVASSSPADTLSPTATRTVATVPVTGNETVADEPGSMVPVACRVCCTVCVVTVAVRYVGASARVDA